MGVPLIGRIAGLSLDTLDAFTTGLCARLVDGTRLQAELGEARAALADRLHAAVPAAAPELRRLLLAVRRDCHNGRSLRKHRQGSGWARVQALAGDAAEGAATLEDQAAEAEAAFRADFAHEEERQRAALAAPLRDPAFLRGLALASPDLWAASRRLAAEPDAPRGRREARAQAALLRYVARAAAKVSPFSTFTTLAVGTLRRGPGLRLRGAEWPARSLVRLKRYRLQQWTDVLTVYPGFRDGLCVSFNDSAVETEPGRLLFVRPGRWIADAERGTLRYRPDALVRTAAQGTVAAARALLADGPVPFAELAARLEPSAESAESVDVRAEVERLFDLGLLLPVLPWPVHEGHLEARMAAYLRTLPHDPRLDAFAARLERLVELEAAYAGAADPAAVLREVHALVDGLWEAAAPLAGVDPARVAYRGERAYDVYEDVMRAPPPERPATAPAFALSGRAAEEALRAGRLLVRLSALFDHGHELRATLADAAAERWPDRTEVGALELFHAAQPLWQAYLAFRTEGWRENDLRRTWNPRGLPELERLRGHRAAVLDALPGCALPDGGGQRVPEAALRALLETVPAAYTAEDGRGACLLLQPASRDGSLWRLNGVAEGTGRVGSRCTPAMDEDVRGGYAAHLAARGLAVVDGERARLLDVQCVQGDTLNVHAPQAPAVLSLPGDEVRAAPGRRLRLRDLRVSFDGPERRPVLRGPGGMRLLPVHLGLAFEAFMPPLTRFLCAFGPGDLRTVLPPRAPRREGDLVVSGRTVLGTLVVHRAAWRVPAAPLAAALADGDDAEAFAAANRLRMAWGIPDRVFVSEARAAGPRGTTYKPQYLDFTSPLFLPLLRDAVAGAGERLAMEEMLPDASMCPRDAAGRRWAMEVVLDSVALNAPRRRRRPALAGAVAADEPAMT